jgi:hypothetical protein
VSFAVPHGTPKIPSHDRRRLMLIGLISDTHGLLSPQAMKQLAGADHIFHAGDIGGPEVIEGLRSIAPTTAVGDGRVRRVDITLLIASEVDAGRGELSMLSW